MKTLFLILAIVSLSFGFGKNKVQYSVMNWEYLAGEHYRLYYHQDMGPLPHAAYLWLDDIYADLSERFGFTHGRAVPVVLYGAPALFEQTNIITEILPEEVGGFTELFKNRVAVPFTGSYGGLRHVLHHEMVHAFVFGAIYEGSIFRAASAQVPLWFNEGLAEVLSSGWNREADMYMLDYVLNSAVPPPGPMLNNGYIAYKGGQSFLYYLYGTGGDSLFNAMLARFRVTRSAESAIESVYGRSLADLGKEWVTELRRIYWPEIGRRMSPSDHASPVTASARDRSRFNLRPRISPNGRKIAFYSDRGDYARIIITDTSGRQLRRIGQHGPGVSFESFLPMSGALAWSPDGEELAFVAKKGGRNDIRIVNAATGRQREAIELPLAAVTGLDWSRDGKNLALTGISGGQAGLYIYNIEGRELSELDVSPFAKASPRFSPNGSKIIYTVTDTAGLRVMPLSEGVLAGRGGAARRQSSNLMMFDIDTKSARRLTDNSWNDKQAVFSPSGDSVLFVSDRNGIDNLYIAKLSDIEDPRPLTDYAGGVGNPDWAADGSAAVFDNFSSQAWNVWYMAEPEGKALEDEALALTRWAVHEESGGAIPFFRKRGGRDGRDDGGLAVGANTAGVDTLISINISEDIGTVDGVDTAAGINTSSNNHRIIPNPERYRLRFSPDLVLFGLGVSSYSGVAGQALAAFSDIMGDHRVTLAGDVQADFSEYAQIFAAYQYQKLRVNFTAGGFYYKYYSYDGSSRYFHDLETGGFAGASYPFSMFSRVDGQVLARRIRRTPVVGADRSVVENDALIGVFGYSFDNILWGITGPLAGLRARARLHVAPPLSFADEAYLSGDVDVRHYAHILRRFVWANRVTFGGTVGLGGGRAARKFFLGGSENWFNYDVDVDNYDGNLQYSYYSDIVTPLRGHRYFGVTGDRMLLMNTEFRFPFVREVAVVWPVPLSVRYISGAVFADAGYAWTRDMQDEKFLPLPVPPDLLGGYGFGMRVNLGIFVLRYDRGWPMGRGGGPINYFSLGAEF